MLQPFPKKVNDIYYLLFDLYYFFCLILDKSLTYFTTLNFNVFHYDNSNQLYHIIGDIIEYIKDAYIIATSYGKQLLAKKTSNISKKRD